MIDGPKSGYENMAIDEAILIGLNRKVSMPTLRVYEWNSPTLSLGCFQKADTIIKKCSTAGIPFVRRITGGRAVLHADEITYSIVCDENEPLFREGISGAYRIITRCLLTAFREIGVPADMHSYRGKDFRCKKTSCFHSPSRYEIIINNRKLVGSSQRRFKSAFLQHGSILFGIDRGLVTRLFGEEAPSRMAWLKLYSSVTKEDFRTILIDKVSEGLNARFNKGDMNDYEISLRDKLVQERYRSDLWNIHNIDRFQENISPVSPV